jgi:hypothetical protein
LLDRQKGVGHLYAADGPATYRERTGAVGDLIKVVGSGEARTMLTALLVSTCYLMAVLFLVIASWMQNQGFRRAATADRAAAACCAVSGLVLPLGEPAVPVAVLVAASLLGVTSMYTVRVGRG